MSEVWQIPIKSHGDTLTADDWNAMRRAAIDRPYCGSGSDDPSFYNASGSEAPAYACMAVSGVQTLDSGEIVKKIAKPSSTFYQEYIFNNGTAIANEGTGTYQEGPEVKVAYDTGTPAVGEGWGPKPSQWTVSKNYPATCIVGCIYNSTDKIMLARAQSINQIIGKLAGALSVGSSATVNVWSGAGGSEAVITDMTVTAFDWLMSSGADDIASEKKVVVDWINGIPYVTEAECP